MTSIPDHRFAALTFADFRELAIADGLSRHERVGFPDSYREGHEAAIFRDIRGKLSNLARRGQTVFDIGCGCSDLPLLLADLCGRHGHSLVLCDSEEMLDHLPDEQFIRHPRCASASSAAARPELNGCEATVESEAQRGRREQFVRKAAGCFPRDSAELLSEFAGRVDAILTYSVLQYVFVESPLFDFIDACLSLLAPGGQLLIGDVPNVSKRKRFFASAAGVRCHQQYTGTDELPGCTFNIVERSKIDDAVVLSILSRARAAGFDAYVLSQSPELPMANRREDILITRP